MPELQTDYAGLSGRGDASRPRANRKPLIFRHCGLGTTIAREGGLRNMTTTALLSSLAFNLAAAGVVGLTVGSAFLPSRQRKVRSENQLVEVLGVPLLAARPLAAQALAQQLLAHWFRRDGRKAEPTVRPTKPAAARLKASDESNAVVVMLR